MTSASLQTSESNILCNITISVIKLCKKAWPRFWPSTDIRLLLNKRLSGSKFGQRSSILPWEKSHCLMQLHIAPNICLPYKSTIDWIAPSRRDTDQSATHRPRARRLPTPAFSSALHARRRSGCLHSPAFGDDLYLHGPVTPEKKLPQRTDSSSSKCIAQILMAKLVSQEKMAGPFIVLHCSTFHAPSSYILWVWLSRGGIIAPSCWSAEPRRQPQKYHVFIGLTVLQHISLRSWAGKDVGV